MPFKDFDAFSVGPLELPYKGKVYTLPEITIEMGLRLTQELRNPDSELMNAPVEDQWELLLGEAYVQMKKDKVPVAFVNRCVLTALADFQYGREAAEATWEAGLDPKALQAYLDSQSKPQEESTSTDAVTSTP
jgi:hypothetical protein